MGINAKVKTIKHESLSFMGDVLRLMSPFSLHFEDLSKCNMKMSNECSIFECLMLLIVNINQKINFHEQ